MREITAPLHPSPAVTRIRAGEYTQLERDAVLWIVAPGVHHSESVVVADNSGAGAWRVGSRGVSKRKTVTTLKKAEDETFVSGLSKAQLRSLDALGQTAEFQDDELILLAGERSTTFYLLLSGSASVEVATDFCTICVQALGPGDAFGWSALLDRHATLFQVRARERCSALGLDGAAVTLLCQKDPKLGLKLLQGALRTAAGRVEGLESRLADFCGLSRAAKTA